MHMVLLVSCDHTYRSRAQSSIEEAFRPEPLRPVPLLFPLPNRGYLGSLVSRKRTEPPGLAAGMVVCSYNLRVGVRFTCGVEQW